MIFIFLLIMMINAPANADYPPNNFDVPVEAVTSSRVREHDFHAVIARAQKVYEPVFHKYGLKLDIRGDWKDGTVNAYASRERRTAVVKMFGGFARVSQMDKYAFAGIVCHEIMHHLGGLPRYSDSWASCEGESDYDAQYCLQTLYPGRARAAGLVLGNVLAALAGSDPVSYSTPDKSKVSRTYCSHPEAQCRTDTYKAGIEKRSRPRCWYRP